MNHEVFTRQQYIEIADFLRARTAHRPKVGLILGSGLNALADEMIDADRIPFADVPGFVAPSVQGHQGQLFFGNLSGQEVVIMQGRIHAYEGHSMQRVTLPVRVMAELGVKTLIVTNAAGGVNPGFSAGELMLITDHIGFLAMVSGNPLWGPNDDTLGPRFLAMNNAYDRELRRLTLKVAAELGIELRQGVYGGLGGPTFETPAEIRFLRMAGVDACGMSTVPEVMVARHMGLRVLGLSGISNATIDDPDAEQEAKPEEVLAAGRAMTPKLMALIRGVLERLGD
ncbi:MAG: purine-nucleoside phosphorylase [Nitrososphaerales archaeon]